jgi:imidazolonepropionase-like amidohydrolase
MNMRKILTLLLALCVTSQICIAANNVLVLKGATIYHSPTASSIADGVIIIQGQQIKKVGLTLQISIPKDAVIIDCSGMFITAGYQNSHVHFTEEK